jgi:hypothetical protein
MTLFFTVYPNGEAKLPSNASYPSKYPITATMTPHDHMCLPKQHHGHLQSRQSSGYAHGCSHHETSGHPHQKLTLQQDKSHGRMTISLSANNWRNT